MPEQGQSESQTAEIFNRDDKLVSSQLMIKVSHSNEHGKSVS